MHHPTILAVAVGVLSALPGAHASLYTKKSPVIQVDAKDYDRLIAKSNHTSIVEFYAPWCGHCKNLKTAYEKAAKKLDGLAKVAAINCDDDANKQFCGAMGVQGFPTLKIVKPNKHAGPGKPLVEDYQGERSASGIVDAVVRKINNHVQKVEDKNIESFLATNNDTAKALLFSDKASVSALLKSIAIDFLDGIKIGQVQNKQTKTVEMFGVDKFPTLILLPGGDAEGIVYDGESNKADMVKFLSQAAEPNPDPPVKGGAKKDAKDTKKEKASSSKSKATATAKAEAESESAREPRVQADPVIVETALPIPTINTKDKLIKECLTDKSHTCVLAFVPTTESAASKEALTSLADLAFKYTQGKRHLFPFFEVPKDGGNKDASELLKALDLSGEVEIIAINARRGWWRRYEGAEFGHEGIERWIDAIRLSEGVKKKLPEGIVAISVEESESSTKAAAAAEPEASASADTAVPESTETESTVSVEATPLTPEASSSDATTEATESTSWKGADPTAEPETARVHEEL